MANLPTPQTTNQIIQNDTTGIVDFLQYRGHQLIASSAHDYGLGSDFKIVASEYISSTSAQPELVAQSKSTGQLDFLTIDASGNLVSSFLTNIPGGLPSVHGIAYFSGTYTLASQLSDGSLDFLGFDAAHNFVGSDLVANTIGLGQLRGAGESSGPNYAMVQSQSAASGSDDSLVTQLADGTIDIIGMTGTFGSLAFAGSSLLSQTAGSAEVKAVNQTNSFNYNFRDSNSANEGMQFLTQTSDGNYDALYVDSGYGTGGVEGTFYASNLTQGFAGWSLVDGGATANLIFPLTYQSA